MAQFKYKAKDRAGKVVSSFIEGESKEDAIDKICQLGYYPINVEDLQEAYRTDAITISPFEQFSLRKNVTNFTRQLASLLKSGIPVLKAIAIILEQDTSRGFRGILEDAFMNIKDGKNLSWVFAKYPMIFDKFYVSMIKVGEDNGTLSEILFKLVDYRKKQDEIKSKISGALAYPLLVGTVGFFSVVFIMTNVMPKLISLIQGMRLKLPACTLALIKTAGFVQDYFYAICLFIILAYILVSGLLRNKQAKLAIDAFKLKLPIFGRLIIESEMANFSQTLKASLESGLQMLKSLELSISVITNQVVIDELEKVHASVTTGVSIGACMKGSKVFPEMVGSMISVGEESGRLTDILGQVAEDYEIRVSETIKVLMTFIEPVTTLLLGAVVGFIVVSLLLPIFSMDILAR